MLHQIDENKTSMVTKLLKHWQAGEVAEKAWLSDYCGSRYDQLLEIHGCLKTLFTCDQHIVYGWVTSQNKAFDGKTSVGCDAPRGRWHLPNRALLTHCDTALRQPV